VPLHRGAEADLYTFNLNPWRAVLKRRVRKLYRLQEMDRSIRLERTTREALALRSAKECGVRTPCLLCVLPDDCSIVMTFIDGRLARDSLDSLDSITVRTVLHDIGLQIGIMHQNQLTHGDLTTSNIIVDSSMKSHLIDFGMSNSNAEVEDMGVDIHLLHRSMATSHVMDSKSFARAIWRGYSRAAGARQERKVRTKVAKIARRGRYFAIR
jgi:Kae1-associated kinase Bud32